MATPTRALRPAQAAKVLGVSVRTFYRVRRECKDFPRGIRVTGSRSVRYLEDEVVEWLRSRERA